MKIKKAFFTIEDLFHVVSGKTTNLQDLLDGNTPYISSTEKNNGIGGYISDEPTFEGNLITVSRNGSVCEVFYQPVPFCASLDDIRVLTPKNFKLNKFIAFYLCSIIKKEKFRYTYGRKFGTERIKKTKIELPIASNKSPDWKWIEEYVKNTLLAKNKLVNEVVEGKFNISPSLNKKISLDIKNWKRFKYGGENGIFIMKNGYYNRKPERTEIGNIPFIGATEYNNGITGYYSLFDIENNHKDERSGEHDLEQKYFQGNCITVSNNGSVGYAFYQENDFTCSHDINVLYLKHREWNKYIAMFVCTLIQLERYRWAYGRKWRPSRMPNSEIKLPVDSKGNPDWSFMENYIKSLPYSSTL